MNKSLSSKEKDLLIDLYPMNNDGYERILPIREYVGINLNSIVLTLNERIKRNPMITKRFMITRDGHDNYVLRFV